MTLRNFVSGILSFFLICGFEASAQTEPSPTPSASAEQKVSDAQSWPDFESAFQAGVKNYRDKKYDQAKLAFNQALQKQPDNVQALTNLALVQFQLGQKGWAVALLRKAHNLDPDFSTPQSALNFILPQLDVKEIPHEIKLWETIRTAVIVPVSLSNYLAIAALTLLIGGWLLLQYFGQRRTALKDETVLPLFPTIPSIIAVLFFISLSLALLKIWDLNTARATVVSDKVTVFSAPNEKSVALFDLFSGLEIIMNTSHDEWVQVTYPGAMTGWVPKASVFQTSGR